MTIGPAPDRTAIRTLVVRDISERKRREEENRRLTAIIRSSDDAVLTKDLSGVITGWNQGAERIYGYSAGEAIGQEVAELLIPSARRGEAKRILKEAAASEVVAFETQRITKRGELIDVALRAFPIRGLSGEVTAVCTVGHDVSAVRRRERAEQRDTEAQAWRQRLRRSLSEGNLLFHGQPILDLRTGEVHHYELLVRMRLIGELTKMGCGVALDDFGTGYGSFTYLRYLPVTQLKIDMEFIRGLAADPADRRVNR